MDQQPDPITQPTDSTKMRIDAMDRGDVSWKAYSDLWKANHGTLLMAFAAGVFFIGAAILAFQQSRGGPRVTRPGRSLVASVEPTEPAALKAFSDEDSPEAAADEPAMHVRVLGGVGPGGLIRIAVYNSAEHFNQPEHAVWKRTLIIDPSELAQCAIPANILAGTFAIAVYQDANRNGQLDRGLLGVPAERYGFSNAARGKVGPPSFEDAAIELPITDSPLEIEIW